MTILLPVLSVAFAAFCIWLGVRIVNRRERWAKWTAVGLAICLPALYLLSIGPAARLARRDKFPDAVDVQLKSLYRPLEWLYERGPSPIESGLDWYIAIWTD